MKKCPKCNKVYDDTWEICMKDKTKLIEDGDETIKMVLSTTPSIEGAKIEKYLDIISGITITGFGAFREFFSGITNALGGRSGSYQKEYHRARELALEDLKREAKKLDADAVIGVHIDYENITANNKSFIMVSATGTAVRLKASN